jgi:hypothetical protein
MNIKKFKFPELSICIPTDKKLLAEAKQRGFYNAYTPYNKLFNELFFHGGKLNFKKDLNKSFKAKAVPYLKAFMGSYEPKHEEKEAICALLLSELVDA